MHYNCIILFPSTNSTLLIQLHRFSDEKNLLISFSKIWTFLDTYLLWAKGRRAPSRLRFRLRSGNAVIHPSPISLLWASGAVRYLHHIISLPSCFGSIDVIVAVNLVSYGSLDLLENGISCVSAWVFPPPLFLTLITMYPSSLHTLLFSSSPWVWQWGKDKQPFLSPWVGVEWESAWGKYNCSCTH